MKEYTKLTGKEINKLKPGDWVAWRKERWEPIGRDTEWAESPASRTILSVAIKWFLRDLEAFEYPSRRIACINPRLLSV